MAKTAPPAGRKTKPKAKPDRVGDIIAQVAEKLGIPVEAALAGGYYESKLKPTATGDRGYIRDGQFTPDPNGPPHSFGIYQLFDLGKGAGMSRAARFDVYTNAMRDLPGMAAAKKANPSLTWGQAFAASQRPADPVAEAAAVDRYIAAYHTSGVDDPVKFFGTLPGSWATTSMGAAYAPGAQPGDKGQVWTSGGRVVHPGKGVPESQQPKVNDWISALDEAMSPPSSGWNILKDTGQVIKFVSIRGGIAVVGIVFIGTGLFLMFGREIFGGVAAAVVPEAKVAQAGEAAVARRAAGEARKAATVGAT